MSVFSKIAPSEELLQQEDNRLTIFPIRFPKIWEMYNKAVSTFWVPEEIDFSRDMDHWNSMNENEQYFIKHILVSVAKQLIFKIMVVVVDIIITEFDYLCYYS